MVGPARGADIGRAPLRTDEAVGLQTTQRAVHPARVAVAVVQRTQPGGELVTVVGAFGEQQQQAGLEEVPRFEIGHR